jgi:hypothetical protein
MGLNLPIAFGDPLHFENDTIFSHEAEYGGIGPVRKLESDVLFKLAHYPSGNRSAY